MVIKNDPTLMFTNAGMNQFKDFFLGNATPSATRIANTQKCLRVSGKHNDLEEVGHDTYHHTMFEMLGNWSFGDYFKDEAIAWAWELLTEIYKIDKKNLYVTVFGGDDSEGLQKDSQAYDLWKSIVDEERIIFGSKKDNFWEMGDSGPCGPCSEIHIDLRDRDEKSKVPGRDLVNTGNPEVIEIWNLVFIEFNRKKDGSLEQLPSRHVDTGMGFERLCLALQSKKSNYDTDIFQSIINGISKISGASYGENERINVAMRVIADHLRAVVFAIADGQLPSNIKAGYVIRRILRRAIRYGYTFLNLQEPFIHRLVPDLVDQMGDIFPEIKSQQELIGKVIAEEESSFLRTLSHGIRKFEQYIEKNQGSKIIDGNFAFELFDTYGFPVDLTQLMAREKGWSIDMEAFNRGLNEQKSRSKQAATKDIEDWVIVRDTTDKSVFVGYEQLECNVRVVRYRKIMEKNKEYFQLVLDKTPFYAESGGQVGDRGYLKSDRELIHVENTVKENELILHITAKLPEEAGGSFVAAVNAEKRRRTANNHSATHLMHAALRKVLGSHVEQKGSLVDENRLRFDFSHFTKLSNDDISNIEKIVNEKIRNNVVRSELGDVPMEEAKKMGAMALFGEKYGDRVRVISFDGDYSVELCGGTHVGATGQIGIFKIISETAIAAGIRRIEAITGEVAEQFIDSQLKIIDDLKSMLKGQKDITSGVQQLIEQNGQFQKQIDLLNRENLVKVKLDLISKVERTGYINVIAQKVSLSSQLLRDLTFMLKSEMNDLFLALGTVNDGKVTLIVAISDNLVNEFHIHAGNMIREMAATIEGSGGGQPHFATAGGKNPDGLDEALAMARNLISAAVR
jgi:alanyl-tRNA synthetase